MSSFDVAGRRRSPATFPEFHRGRAPGNKGMRYPADPPRVEEIVAVMRAAGGGLNGGRIRGLIVVLWRAGLRIQEALDLHERDLDPRGGALLIRHGKGDRRREVGMDEWGWEHLTPWVAKRPELPAGPLFCIIDGPTRGRPWPQTGVRSQLAPPRRRGSGASPVRASSAAPRPCRRDGAGGRPLERDPAPARPRQPRRHLDLSPRHRQRRDHQHDPRSQSANDAGDCRTRAVARAARTGARRRSVT